MMVSACLTWNGATKPFFVNGCGVKMNAKVYKQHLQKELVPAVQHLYKNKNWIFVQDNTPSHRLKIFYKKQSIYVLSKHMNGPHRHLIAIPSITIFGTKSKKRYIKIDLTSHLKTAENWRSGSKVYGKILPSVYKRFKEQSNSLLED